MARNPKRAFERPPVHARPNHTSTFNAAIQIPMIGPTLEQGLSIHPRWSDALMAGIALEAAAGCAAGALVFTANGGGDGMFAALSVTAAITEASLLPGWLWTTGRFAVLPLLLRGIVAVVLLGAAAVLGYFMAMTIILLPVSVFAVAALVGLAATAAERSDWRTGPDAPVRARVRHHILGALLGIALTMAGVLLFDLAGDPSPHNEGTGAWPCLLVGAITLVVASLPHNLMVTVARQRQGRVAPKKALLMRRSAIGSACFVSLAMIMLLLH